MQRIASLTTSDAAIRCESARPGGLRRDGMRTHRRSDGAEGEHTPGKDRAETETPMTRSVLMSWSGGKDSALSLHELRKDDRFRVAALLTTVTEEYDRVSMHGIRRTILERQAESLGLPLDVVLIPKVCSNEAYERRMREALGRQTAGGVSAVAVGDIFLEDLRRYRERKLSEAGLEAVFPIWGRSTTELSRTFIELGFRAIVTCVDTQALDGSFAGREFDEGFLADLPPGVDPCGENGEFHTCVIDGPIFSRPIRVTKGKVVLRENRFLFADLVASPEDGTAQETG